MGAALLKDDPVFLAAVQEQRRSRRAKRLETRWATFELGFGADVNYELVEAILSAIVGRVVSLSLRDALARDVRIVSAGGGIGALAVVDVNEDGVDVPGTNRVVAYEEIIDLMIY